MLPENGSALAGRFFSADGSYLLNQAGSAYRAADRSMNIGRNR